MSPDLLAALSEGQRTVAHLVVLLAVLVIVGLALLIRTRRRRSGTADGQRVPEDEQ
ncbi:MAG: hypothetical protein ACRDV2_12390 [Actinomycetes bacterium]